MPISFAHEIFYKSFQANLTGAGYVIVFRSCDLDKNFLALYIKKTGLS